MAAIGIIAVIIIAAIIAARFMGDCCDQIEHMEDLQ